MPNGPDDPTWLDNKTGLPGHNGQFIDDDSKYLQAIGGTMAKESAAPA